MIWPWSRFQRDAAKIQHWTDWGKAAESDIARRNDLIQDKERQLLIAAKDAEIAAINLRTAERDLERMSNEYNLLKGDFKALVAQTARNVSPKAGSFDFGRDPFVEDPKIPTEWLTDDSELPFIAAEELLDRGQSEDGVPGGSAANPGAERPS